MECSFNERRFASGVPYQPKVFVGAISGLNGRADGQAKRERPYVSDDDDAPRSRHGRKCAIQTNMRLAMASAAGFYLASWKLPRMFNAGSDSPPCSAMYVEVSISISLQIAKFSFPETKEINEQTSNRSTMGEFEHTARAGSISTLFIPFL